MRNFKKAKRKLLLIFTTILTFYFQLSTFNCFSQWQTTNLTVSTDCFAVKGNSIFAGTTDLYPGQSGVYMCSNCCCNWVAEGLPDTAIYALAIKGDTIFAGDNSCGLYYSTDNGNTWALTGLPASYEIYSIGIKGNNIFVGTYNYGVFLSIDGGVSWTPVNNGLPAPSGNKVFAFTFKGDTIFAGTWNYGVYISSNNGQFWTQTNTAGMTGYELDVDAFAIIGNTIFAGTLGDIFSSTNGGNSWNAKGLLDTMIYALAIKGDTIFAGTNIGVCMSLNNGSSWKAINTGLIGDIYAIAIKGDTLFAGTPAGVYELPLYELLAINQINNDIKDISVYPVPAIDKIVVNSKQKSVGSIEILNIQGQIIKTFAISGNKTTIDISALQNGMYFMKVRTEQGIIIKQFEKE